MKVDILTAYDINDEVCKYEVHIYIPILWYFQIHRIFSYSISTNSTHTFRVMENLDETT